MPQYDPPGGLSLPFLALLWPTFLHRTLEFIFDTSSFDFIAQSFFSIW